MADIFSDIDIIAPAERKNKKKRTRKNEAMQIYKFVCELLGTKVPSI